MRKKVRCALRARHRTTLAARQTLLPYVPSISPGHKRDCDYDYEDGDCEDCDL
jgi:hypothetical protein